MTAPSTHRAGDDGRCVVCGELMPCPTRLAAAPIGTTSSASCCKLFGLAQDSYRRTSSALTDRTWDQLDAIGAIVLAAAAAEAFINETAEWARQAAQNPPEYPPLPAEIGAFADAVLAVEAPHKGPRDTPTKFRVAIEVLSGKPPDAGSPVHQQFGLLMCARDGILHTKLDVQPAPAGALTSDLPALVALLESRKITGADPVVPTSAIDRLTTRAVARWACNSAADMVLAVIASMPPGGDEPAGFRVLLSLDQCTRYFTRLPAEV